MKINILLGLFLLGGMAINRLTTNPTEMTIRYNTKMKIIDTCQNIGNNDTQNMRTTDISLSYTK